jgi:hypothetical protein
MNWTDVKAPTIETLKHPIVVMLVGRWATCGVGVATNA